MDFSISITKQIQPRMALRISINDPMGDIFINIFCSVQKNGVKNYISVLTKCIDMR